MKKRPPTFQQAMKLMRARDGMTQEDGFHGMIPIVKNHVPELLEEFRREKNRGLRAWLVELLGMARSEQALPFFDKLLDGPEESLRCWARIGLEKLDTKAARSLLWERGLKPPKKGS